MNTQSDVIARYSQLCYRVAYAKTKSRYDAEDIMQDVFLSYFTCGTEFLSEEHIKAWFIRATINRAKNFLSSGWYKKTVALEAAAETQVDTEYDEDSMKPFIMALPEKYRVVTYLHYYEDMTIKSIALALSKPEATISTQLSRARDLLRKQLKEEGKHHA